MFWIIIRIILSYISILNSNICSFHDYIKMTKTYVRMIYIQGKSTNLLQAYLICCGHGKHEVPELKQGIPYKSH